MSGTQIQLTGQLEIAGLARKAQDMRFTSLNKYLTTDWLRVAYERTRKDGAVGVDGQTAADFEQELTANLSELLELAKSGRYRAPAVRRAYIPKGDGVEMRPLGIPTFADKVMQRAVCMILEPLYEQDFLDCSYGFRPGRSALNASNEVDKTLFNWGACWVIDVDVRKYFDSIPHDRLVEMVEQRIGDGVIRRLIGKWLNAGVMEDGVRTVSDVGSPQGGVISPLLANIYMHYVLDKWFYDVVKSECRGEIKLVRYADDFVVCTKEKADAERIYSLLGKRFEEFGLCLHESKTRILHFSVKSGSTFDFLGFTHYWGKSQHGRAVPKRKTAKDRLRRIADKAKECCKSVRQQPLKKQVERINRFLSGVFNYYGVMHNSDSLGKMHFITRRHWYQSLRRRGQKGVLTWADFNAQLKHLPLVAAYIRGRSYATA